MDKLSNFLIALMAFFSIFVSGCIIPLPEQVTGNGVVIDTFEPEFSNVFATEPVNFRLYVRNEGSVEATHVHAEVLGLDEDWCCENAGVSGEGNWEDGEKLPNEEECQYTGDGFTLHALDPSMGTSGGTHMCTWSYRAPDIERGFTLNYEATVRLFYTYSSGITKLITFGPSTELKTLQDRGSPLSADVVSRTESPIRLDIETKGPIRVWDSSVTFPLEITIENVGGGVACFSETTGETHNSCKKTSEGRNKDKVKLSIGGEGINHNDCDEKTKNPISLYKGKTNTVVCDVTASNLGSGSTTQKRIEVSADYEYYIDRQTSVTVTG